MRKNIAGVAVWATLVALAVVHFSTEARGEDDTSSLRDAASTKNLAESLVSRREATLRRAFDPAYRYRLVEALSSLPSARLEALESEGADAPLPNLLGDTSADLVYTPVVPCRAFDTRLVGGPLAAGEARNFLVATGSASLAGQGGSASGCGIPMGLATVVMINLTAEDATGAGNLRAWAVASPQNPQPFASTLNFGLVGGIRGIGNEVAVWICDPATDDCSAGDLRVQANLASTNLVGDVVGYFSRFTTPVETTVTFDGPTLPPSGPGTTDLATIEFVAPATGTAILTGRGHCVMHPGIGGDNMAVLIAGLSPGHAANSPVGTKGVVSVPSVLPSAGYHEAWSLRREIPVTAGANTTVTLFAAHSSGGAAFVCCRGTFTVRTTF
jgi:hypothetical protein